MVHHIRNTLKRFSPSILGIIFFFYLFFSSQAFASQVTVLHSFTGSDGNDPQSSLVRVGETFYGMTQTGGDDNEGVIFSIQSDGSDYTVLHELNVLDGSLPGGALIHHEGVLYGMTYTGGSGDVGTIFSIETDGSNFTLLREFEGGEDDGGRPLGSLLRIDSTLYGMTTMGGADDIGLIFSIGIDGTGFTIVHEFTDSSADGSMPKGSLTYFNGLLYGMTSLGGANDLGTVFSIDTDGSNFTILYSFLGGTDGELPESDLFITDKIYGMTPIGGTSGLGIIFRMDLNGDNYQILHTFLGGELDGDNPHGALILHSGTLYGTTNSGGTYDQGTVFSIRPNGENFRIVNSFRGGSTDGEHPLGSLVFYDAFLYGLTSAGGTDASGTIFKLFLLNNSAPSPGVSNLSSCTNDAPIGVPELFEVHTNATQATLYFVPLLNATNYIVSYGFGEDTTQFAVMTNQGYASGALTYTINSLPSNTPVSFTVSALNGCAVGENGNTMRVNTTTGSTATFYYYSED